ncbi:MAG: HIT family protein [Minisyncoccia bacterium]
MDCLFCKIISKEIPGLVVYEDEATLGFLDINPRAPGHTVIIPKKHGGYIFDFNEAELGKIFSAVKNMARKINKALSPDGFTIGINHGKSAGQVVEHLHIHIMPRFKDDGGGSIHSVVSNPPAESLEEIRKKILSE